MNLQKDKRKVRSYNHFCTTDKSLIELSETKL